MADELHDIVESIRARVQAELEGQLRALTERHQQALAEATRIAEADARRAAQAEAEQLWSARVQAAHDEAQRRAQEAIASVRAEMERALTAEREQGKARAEEDQRRAAAELEKARAELEKARTAFDTIRAADRAAHEAARGALEAQLSSRSSSRLDAGQLTAALREIDAADSVSSTLAAIARAAARQPARATVFVASGEQLREWEVPGATSLAPAPLYVRDSAIGVIGEAVRRRELVRSANDGAPPFASLAAGRTAIAAPLLLDGQAVGVLYADEGSGGSDSDAWIDALELIASHGSARLGYLTALRTAQAMHWLGSNESVAPSASPSSDEEEQAARRYARLLVSEIKLYNEGAVRVGREQRDLRRRLAEEIDRAQRLFEQRVPATVAGRAQLFHNELVQTLAGGDASLLGS